MAYEAVREPPEGSQGGLVAADEPQLRAVPVAPQLEASVKGGEQLRMIGGLPPQREGEGVVVFQEGPEANLDLARQLPAGGELHAQLGGEAGRCPRCPEVGPDDPLRFLSEDRKSTRLNSSH